LPSGAATTSMRGCFLNMVGWKLLR